MTKVILIEPEDLTNMLEELIEKKLKQHLDNTPVKSDSQTPSEIYTVAETCKKLKICRKTLYDLIKDGRVKSFSIGRKRCFRVDDINNFINSK